MRRSDTGRFVFRLGSRDLDRDSRSQADRQNPSFWFVGRLSLCADNGLVHQGYSLLTRNSEVIAPRKLDRFSGLDITKFGSEGERQKLAMANDISEVGRSAGQWRRGLYESLSSGTT